ncbi:hypothetical protein LGH82_06420 [Mesorhizobium sp. PAMC28654]|uniref:hypothetical protein n=1 Tax=Mesorhizobium sp. PAMC28654 TaxID=2880934 RepID=UPI001D0B211D|nr:hypothetical protein [Mesorhizobium sp. PAMC28654]UDL90919.1 hypothetical protein LGH82_06420 [Mesorhizobium sp. PAMC28654]
MMVMMVVMPPLVMMMSVVMVMAVHAVSRRRLDGTGQANSGQQDGNEAGSECAFQHDGSPGSLIEATIRLWSISRDGERKGSENFQGQATPPPRCSESRRVECSGYTCLTHAGDMA